MQIKILICLILIALPLRFLNAGLETALKELSHELEDGKSLAPLIEKMSDARVILMGEASHGTHEFYYWRAEISRQLIEQGSIGFIAFEGDFDAFEKLDRYVRLRDDGGESAREILLSFNRWPRWMWANEDMVEFIEWIRSHNSGLPFDQRVALVGKDVYGLWNSLDRLMEFIESEHPERLDYWETSLGPLLNHRDDPRGYIQASLGRGDSARQGADRLVRKLADLWSEDLEGEKRMDRFALLKHSRVVQSGEAHYRASASPGQAGWNRRAEHMHATVQALLAKHQPDRKGIVWAHNTHVGDARATGMARQNMVNIGQLSRQEMGNENVFIVGFSSYKGTVLAGRQWQGARQLMQVPEAQPGSMDAELQGLGLGDIWIYWGAREELPRELRARWHTHRAIGVVYDPASERQGNYVRTIFPERYDALLFIEETRALEPLHASERN